MGYQSQLAFKDFRPGGRRWTPAVESFLEKLEAWLGASRFAFTVEFIPEKREVFGMEACVRIVPDTPGSVSITVSAFSDGESEPEFHFSADAVLPEEARSTGLTRSAGTERNILWAGENDFLDTSVVIDMCRAIATGHLSQRLLVCGSRVLGDHAQLSYGDAVIYSYYSGVAGVPLIAKLLTGLGVARLEEIRYPAWETP